MGLPAPSGRAVLTVGDSRTPPGVLSKVPEKKPELRDPTLTDLLIRDLASGQVRRLRSGGRRGTFSGGQNPYDSPTLGG